MEPLLEVKDLKTYFFTEGGTVKAVDGISYHINAGETVGIVGESGCGKSVSALSVMRLIPNPPGRIVNGEIIFGGLDLMRSSDGEIRKVRGSKIAMIFQEPMTSLNPVLTIGRQISEVLELHLQMDKVAARERTIDLLRMVGILAPERRLNDYPHMFSGGMRQRVMIAMALSCNPRLLIADEPTTAVDVTTQAQLLEIMKESTEKLGTALVLITHSLGVAARYTHRVYVMYAGRIVEHANTPELYQNPQHPYTMGLLASVPRLDQPKKERLVSIQGQPPDLTSLPQGCPFRPRCNHAVARCVQEIPSLLPVGEEHFSACWKAAEGHL